MFPKILPRHHNLRGAVFYVFTTGGRTVHTDPHIVAAWDEQLCDPILARPDKTGLRALVDRMDAPRVLRGIDVKAGHAYHVPIAAHRDDGLLGDDQWRRLAYEVVGRLGLSGCRWIAVHHGPSRAGNDHIHLIVQLVDDAGKLARLSYDKTKIRAWAREVEERLDLVRTGRDGTGARPLSRAEHDRARTTGVEPQRRTLERLVRAAAGTASSAEEFVAALHEQDVTVRARIRAGRVIGYSVALHPDLVHDGAPSLELSGSQLARDLSLPRLQGRWPDDYASDHPHHWTNPTPEHRRTRDIHWRLSRNRVEEARHELDQLDPDDRHTWNAAIDQAADFAALLAVQVDPTNTYGLREPLRATATDLAAAARLSRPDPSSSSGGPRPIVLPTLLAATRVLARTKSPELAAALLVIAAFAVLVLALADRQSYDRKAGQSGAHLRSAATHLALYRKQTESGRSPTAPRPPVTSTNESSISQQPPVYRPPAQVPRGRTR